LFFSPRANAVAYENGARICFNKPLSLALVVNANSEVIAPDQVLIAAERNRESQHLNGM